MTLGPEKIDSWFGSGTAMKIWEKTKQIAGYHFDSASGTVDGIGFTENNKHQVFSGEWSLGAINMLRVLSEHYDQHREKVSTKLFVHK